MGNRARKQRQQEIERRRVQSQLAKGLPTQNAPVHLRQASFRQIEQYNGPLPHPKLLAQFEEIVPGSAARLFAELETEGAHRRTIEAAESAVARDGFKEQIKYYGRGQTMAFIIAIAGMGVSALAIYKDHPAEGVAFGSAVILALVVAFLRRGAPKPEEGAEPPGEKSIAKSGPGNDPR